jgi:NAD-dependent deacetylase
LRPAVVWFGEGLCPETLARAAQAAREASVVMVIGTSSLVHPAAALPEIAHRAGAYVVEVNPEPTPVSALAHERFPCAAGEILPALAAAASAAAETRP